VVEVFTMPQGSEEWYAARRGIVTASEFGTLLMQGKGGGDSKTRRTYMLKLMGERLTGDPMYHYVNDHMERGHDQEPDARNMYAFQADVEPQPVGFIKNGNVGCSPDSLIGDVGMLEIKTKLAHLHLDVLLGDAVPNEHMAQIQGQLWVAEREWCDFVSYCPKLPLFVKRVQRDDAFIERLRKAVDLFEREMATLMEAVQPKRRAA
jgi:YqaJ-like viral recombinase domain.